jgi:hypothetical protein
MWERNGQAEEVALYVRALAVAERPKAIVASRTLVRQLMHELGISAGGMLRLRWIIAPQTGTSRPQITDAEPVADIRSRLRAV